MESFAFILIGTVCSVTIFSLGWVTGCWFVEDRSMKHNDYTDEFYENYYSQYDGSCGKDKHLYDKPVKKKSKKSSKK